MEGLELSTPALSGRCSDQLSYITILSGAAVAYPGPTHLHRGFIQQSSLSLLAGVVSHLSLMASTIWCGLHRNRHPYWRAFSPRCFKPGTTRHQASAREAAITSALVLSSVCGVDIRAMAYCIGLSSCFCFPRYFSGVWAALFCRLLIEPPGAHACPAVGATLYLVGPEIGQGQSVGLVSAIDHRRPLLWSYPPYWRLACEHTSCSWPPVSRLFLQFLHVHPNGLATNMAHWSSLPLRYEYCILGIRQFMQVCDMVAVAGRRIATFPALASRRCDVVLRRGRPAAPRGLAAAWWTIRESNS